MGGARHGTWSRHSSTRSARRGWHAPIVQAEEDAEHVRVLLEAVQLSVRFDLMPCIFAVTQHLNSSLAFGGDLVLRRPHLSLAAAAEQALELPLIVQARNCVRRLRRGR
jgi:hypothetical protein